MANDGNGGNDNDSLLQHLISPRTNPPLTLLPSLEDNDVDVAIPMPMTPSEIKDRLIGPSPPSVLVQNPSPSSSDYPTVKPKSTHHEFNRSISAPVTATMNERTHPVDHVSPRSISGWKSLVTQAIALLIVYISVMSVATVVYGDWALKTLPGWLLASIWLLVSTLAVAQALVRYTKARLEGLANIVLAENMSISEFYIADIHQNGYISKSEYAIYKLMNMGKITHLDMMRINNQFDMLDRTNRGKITRFDLLETSTNDV